MIILDPERYMPYDYSYKGVKFELEIEKPAVENVTYTKSDFGYLGSETQGSNVVDLTHSGNVNLIVDAKHGYLDLDNDTTITSYKNKEADYIKDFEVRLDVLDRDQGIAAGYLRFETTDYYGNIVDVEGYFAESYKNDGDRPSVADLYSINNPAPKNNNTGSGNSGASGNTGRSSGNSSGGSSGTTGKLNPKLTYVKCTNCGGTGKIKCTICNGVGYKEYMGYRYGVYGLIIDPCIYCGGAGYKLCTVCGGTGTVAKVTY